MGPIRSAVRALTALAALAGALAACGGQLGAPTPPTESEYPAAFAGALCGHLSSCCQTNALPFSAQTCLAYASEVTAPVPGATYYPDAAASCIARIAAAASRCDDSLGLDPFLTACMNVYGRSQRLGQSCSASTDCAPDPGGNPVNCQSILEPDGGAEPEGQCAVTVFGSSSQAPCWDDGGTRVLCAPGWFCGQSGCEAPLPQGAHCTGVEVCVGGDLCEQSSGTCVPPLALGAACSDGLEQGCGAGAYCSTDTGFCTPALGPGDTCETDAECGQGYCWPAGARRCTTSALAIPEICGP